jgi:hypothetical protein
LHLPVAVLLHRGVADLVAFGLTGLSEQDQRCAVRPPVSRRRG